MSTDLLLTLITLTLTIVLLAISLFTLRKVRRIDQRTWSLDQRIERSDENTFRQLEALIAIYWDLRPSRALPATRGWAGSPDFLYEVANHARRTSPESVVECSSGVSTLILARTLQLIGKGHVFSLEHDELYADRTRSALKEHGLEDWATVIHTPLKSVVTAIGEQPWYDISDLPTTKIDLLVVDGPPSNLSRFARFPALPVLHTRLSLSCTIFLDDADRPEEKEIIKQWVETYRDFSVEHRHCEKGLTIMRRSASPASPPTSTS